MPENCFPEFFFEYISGYFMERKLVEESSKINLLESCLDSYY